MLKKRGSEIWTKTTFAGRGTLLVNTEGAGFQVMEDCREKHLPDEDFCLACCPAL